MAGAFESGYRVLEMGYSFIIVLENSIIYFNDPRYFKAFIPGKKKYAHTNQSCVQAIELMYTAAGTNGIYKKNKMAHYLSDAQVLRQHGFMNESRYETAAQVFFGLPPDLPIIAL